MGLLTNRNIIGIGSQQGAWSNYIRLFAAYNERVEADSGLVASDLKTMELFRLLEPTLDSIELAISGVAGSKLRTDGIFKYHTKLYDMGANNNDATQTTELSQPYQSGVIAPNEFPSLFNPNGDERYMEHPEISFAADEAWTVTTVLNWNGADNANVSIFGKTGNCAIRVKQDGFNIYRFISSTSVQTNIPISTDVLLGKNKVLTFVASGAGLLSIYNDGVFVASSSIATDFDFVTFLRGRNEFTSGSISEHFIRRQALTPAQVLAEATLLQTIHPDIPSVQIGTQDWATSSFRAVASSNGTVITEAADNTDWATGASRWRYYNEDSSIGSWAGKLYNKAARDVIISNPPSGYHIATEAELTTLSVSGGNALKKEGTDYFNTTGGTNSTGFTALGTGMVNTDGTFQDLKNTSTFWCADSDKVLKLNHDDNTATIVVAAANEGHAIRLVKD